MHGPINITFAPSNLFFISSACACTGVMTGARYGKALGKCFCISILTVGQQEDMMTSMFPSRMSFSYCFLTIVAPTAVSSTILKPSFSSASRMVSIVAPGYSATNDGAMDAATFPPFDSMTPAFSISLCMLFAPCGHTLKHWPHNMHSSDIMCAWSPENLIDFTGQCRMHL